MKILCTGSNGMLGRELKTALKNHDLLTPRRHELNVSNVNQVMKFTKEKPDLIIHLAAETDHEYCDANPTQCYFVNTVGTAYMVNLAKELDIPIIYQSAASVFDGKKKKPYSPKDIPNPINNYNMSKYWGEIIVKEYKKHIILRTGWLFGGGENDKKFLSKIIKKINAGEKEIKVCDDCIGCPTYARDLATAYSYVIDNLTDGHDFGTYNCVNYYEGNGVSRFEYAQEIVKDLGVDVKIIPCQIDDLKEEFPCKRTNYEVLEMGIKMPEWKQSLKGCIDANYRD